MLKEVIKGVAKNTSIMMVQQVFTWGSTILLMMFMPRILGPVAYGRLYLATSLTDIFKVLITFGGSYLVAKAVSRSLESTPQILMDAIGFRLLLTLVSIVGIGVLFFFGGYPEETRLLIAICAFSLLWQSGYIALFGCYQGHEMVKYISFASVAERVFGAVVGVAALLMGANVVIVGIILIIGNFLNFFVLAIFVRRVSPTFHRISWKGSFEQLKESTPYFIFTGLSILYYKIDSVMLSKMTPEVVVGWFGGAHRLFDTLSFVPSIYSVVIFPVLARLWGKEGDTHRRTTHKSLEYIIMAAIPIAVAVILLANDFVALFYGLLDYTPSVLLLQILSMGLIFLYVDMILGTTLLASDKQRKLSIVSLCAIPVNVGLNFILIPHFQSSTGNGAIGAATATGLTEFCVMCGYLSLMPTGIFKGFRYHALARMLVAGLLMGGLIWLARFVGIPLYAIMLIGPIVYLVLLFLLGAFEKAESEFLLHLLKFDRVQRFFGKP